MNEKLREKIRCLDFAVDPGSKVGSSEKLEKKNVYISLVDSDQAPTLDRHSRASEQARELERNRTVAEHKGFTAWGFPFKRETWLFLGSFIYLQQVKESRFTSRLSPGAQAWPWLIHTIRLITC